MKNSNLLSWLCLLAVLIVTPTHSQTDSDDESTLDDDNIYELSPFEVSTSSDVGYLATNTLAGTRLNTELRDVGSAISVITKEFIEDTGATDTETLLVYTTNTEVAGVDGNFTNVSNGGTSYQGQGSFLTPHNNTRVRGLAAADNTRDYFVTEIPWESYNVERIDLQRGPNSILFGLGSPAGILNTALKEASFIKDFGELDLRVGRFESYRASIDYNDVVLEDELAFRVAALRKKTNYQQEPAFSEDERYYGAFKYDPKFLNTDSMKTSLKMKFEVGEVTSNRPRTVTPGDNITPWFDSMNKLTIDPYDNRETESGRPNTAWENDTFADGTPNPAYSPYIGNWGQLFGGILAIWDDHTSSSITRYFAEPEHTNQHTPHGDVVGGVSPALFRAVAGYNVVANNLGLPGSELGQYKVNTLKDPSIFDFYHQLIDGDNKREMQEWDTVNLNFSQSFLDNMFGYEFVYDKQNYENEFQGLISLERQNLYIDINHNLPDGTPNPNVGRPFVTDSGRWGNAQMNESIRESVRFSAYLDLDVSDLIKRENWFTKFMGRQIFNGVYSKLTRKQYNESAQRYTSDAEFGNLIGYTGFDQNQRQINTVHYLGPSLMDRSTASGANIPNIQAIQYPTDGSVYVFDNHWNTTGVDFNAPWINPISGLEQIQADNPANYVGWTNAPLRILDSTDSEERGRTLTAANNIKDEVTSNVFVWQGFWWDGVIVTTYGYRKDESDNWTKSAPFGDFRLLDVSDIGLDEEPSATQEGSAVSWSVVAHLTDIINSDRLPFNLSVFYNKSENFQPAAGRFSIFNEPLPAPSGETEDYGFMLSTKENRYALRVNWYETAVKNDANNVLASSQWVIGIAENWGHSFATRFRDDVGPTNFVPQGGMSPEETAALEAAAIEAWFANPPTKIIEAWGGDLSTETLYTSANTARPPQGMTATADTLSKGMEIELLANPTDNLRISINASKTEAIQTNVGGVFADYVEERLEYYRTTPAGDMRIWWGGGPTILQQMAAQGGGFLGQFELMKLQEGAAQPEMRKWRFNVVANYNFTEGRLRGFNVGGGIRWQDDVVIGYALKDREDGSGQTFDLDNPYRGEARTNFDLWAGYRRKINDKIDWRIQLNVRNAFADNELIPISTQPDGSPAAVRIAPGMTWELKNTFKF